MATHKRVSAPQVQASDVSTKERPFATAEVTWRSNGPTIAIAPTNPTGRKRERRSVNMYIYRLACEIEGVCSDKELDWLVRVEAQHARVVIELAKGEDLGIARKVVAFLTDDLDLL